ncbi:MAG: type V CRISPR-associated protein Cas12a/Cpf1 [Candidatus Altimarinota bacterium]
MSKIFSNCKNLYSLSKTLRFELVPVGETRNKMNENLEYDENLKTFFKDQNIEDAYQVLKPVFDKIHEEFITKSLENNEVKKIVFGNYFKLKSELLKIDKKGKEKEYNDKKKEIEAEEKSLRKQIVENYKIIGEDFIKQVGNNEKGKPILKEKSFKVLTESGILKYIQSNIDYFVSLKLETREEISAKKLNKNLVEKSDLEKALGTTEKKGVFEGFFTYFGGFNQNRENYYSDEDKSTSVSNRIINENLPKFVDNIFLYEKQKSEYDTIFNELKNANKILKIKDKNGKEKEVIEFYNNIFDINHFKNCLSQNEIEDYNQKIGDNNYLINLYNQLNGKKDGFKKLPQFKILFKQIGCGEKHDFIISIKDDDDLIDTLIKVKNAGKKYFQDNAENRTINDFIYILENLEEYKGVYWNKQAINTISSKYFANWHELEDKLVANKTFKEDKKSDEKIKIPDAIELSDLAEVLDSFIGEDWQKEGGIFFKNSIFDIEINKKIEEYKGDEEGKQRLYYIKRKTDIIKKSNTPSKALLSMILDDLKDSAEKFLKNTDVIENEIVKIIDFKNDNEKSKIKLWIDETITINRILKYFVTKDSKRKGSIQNSDIENILKTLFEFDWFGCYDNVRNYLTKKPQSEINKLKLNFENGSLLGGWSDGQEKLKGAVILKKGDNFYVGILSKKKNIFDTENENNELYNATDKNIGRLILANLKFQTLAGKGFLGEFGISYGEMGKENPQKAIDSLKKIIQDRYVKKYPLLQKILNKQYTDKKIFDKDIQDILQESYVCEFKSINWNEIEKFIKKGELYIFEIKCNQNKIQWNYWQETFIENSIIQLNGGAEIFFRPPGIEKVAKKGYEGKLDKKTGENYIVGNKRFSEEKFLFHCPIKINYKSKSYSQPKYGITEINTKINEQLTKTENISNICFLGIDRGEKHLAYYSLVDQNGKLLKQGSFNEINGQDYNAKLEELSKNRDEARKNWQTIGTIKEMKDGYISQVVHEIVKLAIENNAFIVLENLNTGFKRGRQKIEKQVYQKLELALAKKLNFVVDKKAKDGDIMSVQNALQLTPPVNNFGDIENAKQYGIMLYTRANYTSQTDPKTGWRKSIYLKKGSEENIKKQICENFIDFGFDGNYYFSYIDKNTNKKWTLYSGINGESLDRYRGKLNNNTNIWEIEKVNIVEILDGVFENFDKSKSLKIQILQDGKELKKIGEFTAWESLRYVIEMIQQIRNSGPKDTDGNPTRDDDFILSPIRDVDGKHFDSREFLEQENPEMPNSGDANGAFNIARKGIIQFGHIQKNLEQYISDIEYDCFLAGNDKWEEYLEKYKKDLIKKGK